jgi:PAS domain S-box-containing protein
LKSATAFVPIASKKTILNIKDFKLMKNPGVNFYRIILYFCFIAISLWFIPLSGVQGQKQINSAWLTGHEKQWLADHPVIRIAPDPYFPPIESIDSNGEYTGIAADFMQLVQKETGINFQVIPCNNWDEVLEKARSKKIDALPAAAQTPERSKYLLYADPHIVLPGVIITRAKVKGTITLKDLLAMRVSVVRSYVWQEFLEADFPGIQLDLTPDLQTGLKKVALGISDALVATLPVALYYIEEQGITNLRVAGETGYHTRLSFASRNDWPELNTIVDKALARIHRDKKEEILGKWIPLKRDSIFTSTVFWIILIGIVGGFSLIILAIAVWNRFLKKAVNQKTKELKTELAERKRIEAALRKSEMQYRLLADNVSDVLWTMDMAQQLTYVSPSILKFRGYTPAEALQISVKDSLTPESYERAVSAIMEEIAEEGKPGVSPDRSQILELEHIRKDGGTVWGELTTSFIRDEGGSPSGFIGITRDINERKRAEKTLRESEQLMISVFESIQDGISVLDTDLSIRHVNSIMEKWYSEDLPLEGKKCFECYHNANKPCNPCPSLRCLKSGRTESNVVPGLPGSSIEWIELFSYPIKNAESGEITGVAEFIRDITARKRAEKEKGELESQLHQAQKMESIGNLSGGIAHDFNNILSIILGNTELALDDMPGANSTHFNLKEIKTASLRAKNIVSQLLAFSRKTDQNLQPTAIVPVIKDALAFLRSTIPSTININANIVDACETVSADPVQLNQVMMNLCINAFHAMEETGGIIAVNVESIILDNTSASGKPDLAPGDYVKITISDTGPGIDRKIIDKIFDPYFTTKDAGKGSGMGLAIVHGIVKNHGGSISVDSVPGKGAVFTILLPKITEQPKIKSEPEIDLPTGNETILFVDDEESIMELGQLIMEYQGYTVDATTSPADALKRFRLSPDKYDLIVSDMTMPQMTGVALAEELLRIRPDIPIIICTGYSPFIDEEKAKAIGIAAYAMKPISRQKIAKIIRQVLDAGT